MSRPGPKNSTVILGTIAAALAIAAAYKAYGLSLEQERLHAEMQRRTQLEARIKQLEQMYAALKTSRGGIASKALEAAFADAKTLAKVSDSPVTKFESLPETSFSNNPLARRQAMLDDPQRRSMLVARRVAAMRIRFSGMGRELGLPSGQEDGLLQLLAEHQFHTMQTMMDQRHQDPAAAQAEREFRKNTQEAELKALLGNEKYQEYLSYQQSMPERQQLKELRGILDSNMAMRSDQEQQLMKIMSEERERRYHEQPTLRDAGSAPLDREALIKLSEENRIYSAQANQRTLERAAGVLSQDQLNRFTELNKLQAAARRAGSQLRR